MSPAGFALSVTPTSQNVSQGNSTNYLVTSTPAAGFTDDVTFSVSGLPVDASASFSPDSVTGGAGSSTLNVATSPSTPTGPYTLTISGTSGTLIAQLGGQFGSIRAGCLPAVPGSGWIYQHREYGNQSPGHA